MLKLFSLTPIFSTYFQIYRPLSHKAKNRTLFSSQNTFHTSDCVELTKNRFHCITQHLQAKNLLHKHQKNLGITQFFQQFRLRSKSISAEINVRYGGTQETRHWDPRTEVETDGAPKSRERRRGERSRGRVPF